MGFKVGDESNHHYDNEVYKDTVTLNPDEEKKCGKKA